MSFRIAVKTLQGSVLTFSVSKYDIDEWGFVTFTDAKSGQVKKFHSSNCEIYPGGGENV